MRVPRPKLENEEAEDELTLRNRTIKLDVYIYVFCLKSIYSMKRIKSVFHSERLKDSRWQSELWGASVGMPCAHGAATACRAAA